TLMELVSHQPRSLDAMRRISGVGASKLEHYGEAFVTAITAHTTDSDDDRAEETARHRKQEIHALFSAGMNAETIAQHLQSPPAAGFTHLARLIEQGAIEVNDVINLKPAEWDVITDTLLACDAEPFNYKSVYDSLDGVYDYGTLRCVHASLLREMAAT